MSAPPRRAQLKALAKINLSLKVLGKRPDGFLELFGAATEPPTRRAATIHRRTVKTWLYPRAAGPSSYTISSKT
jgi:hypothetical protein